MTTPAVLTIGHSNQSIERFIELLRAQAVTAIADVRSQPYSRLHPDFNREALAEALKRRGIAYVFLGRELGARPEDPACYENGRVQYRILAERQLFKIGLRRVVEGAKAHRLALLCAEKEPLACHRTLLVSRALEAAGTSVTHIHADGGLESHADAMTRLLRLLGMPDADLFRSQQQLIADACAAQEQRIAYVDEKLRVEMD
ncbi:MAG: DUF488 family protein [Thermoanaerobaculia bacterium]